MSNSAMTSSICFSVQKDCVNSDSYGVICVGCGCCSKDNTVRYPARLRMYEEHLQEQLNFDNWIPGCKRVQRHNRKLNITYNKRRIARYRPLVNELRRIEFYALGE